MRGASVAHDVRGGGGFLSRAASVGDCRIEPMAVGKRESRRPLGICGKVCSPKAHRQKVGSEKAVFFEKSGCSARADRRQSQKPRENPPCILWKKSKMAEKRAFLARSNGGLVGNLSVVQQAIFDKLGGMLTLAVGMRIIEKSTTCPRQAWACHPSIMNCRITTKDRNSLPQEKAPAAAR
jgi:hypothetical protein